MSNSEQRLERIRGHIRDVHDELHALPAEEGDAHEVGLARLDAVVAYAVAVLAAADGRLVSTAAFTAVQAAACAISNNPRAALENADASADALVDALTLLPLGAGEEERQARDFLQSAAERLLAVREEVDAEAKRLQELRVDVDRWTSEAEQTIAGHAKALGEQAELQKQAFDESQRANAAEFQAAMEAFHSEREGEQKRVSDEAEARLAELRRMADESATLVETIAVAGISEHHRRQGRRQRIVAEVLRGLTVLATLGAVAVALIATTRTDATVESLVANLFAALLLVGLAAYFARQSARHRAREERAAALQFELAAFSPFVEALTPERREQERVMMTRKLFGTAPPAPAGEDGAAARLPWRRKSAPVPPEKPLEAAGIRSLANGNAPH